MTRRNALQAAIWPGYHWYFAAPGAEPKIIYDIFSRCEPRRPCLTLFVMGHWKRDWGFYVPHRGWVPWRQFVAENGQEEA